MNLVKKREGRIKWRCAADECNQRRMEGYEKSDTISPTVYNTIVFITTAIDAHKDQDVMILDTPEAFFHALTKDNVIMLLRGPLLSRNSGPDRS